MDSPDEIAANINDAASGVTSSALADEFGRLGDAFRALAREPTFVERLEVSAAMADVGLLCAEHSSPIRTPTCWAMSWADDGVPREASMYSTCQNRLDNLS